MTTCNITCPSSYSTLIEFFEPPTTPDANNEVEICDVNDWVRVGAAYAAVHTGTAREVWKASQHDSQVTAVVECAWNTLTSTINGRHAIRIYGEFYYVIAADDRDKKRQEMVFWTRSEKSRVS